MQAIKVKRATGRFGIGLSPELLVLAALVAIALALMASIALTSNHNISGTDGGRPSGITQQSVHGNLAGDDVNAGTPDHSQPTEGFLP